VPATTTIDAPEALLALDDLPVQLKPAQPVALRDGRLVRGRNRVCADRGALAAAARAWAGGPLLAQPLLRGVGEGVFGLADDRSEVHAWSAHRRVRMMNPQGSGSSACRSVPVDPETAGAAARLLAEAGWHGLFMVELLRDEAGTPWFMELNGRAWGSMALARRAGLEYPAWAVDQCLDPAFEVPATAPHVNGVCRHLGRELIHVAMVLRGPAPGAPTWPSRAGTLRDVLRVRRSDRWYNWDRHAPSVLLDDTIGTLLDHLPRGGRP
jgi:hypothetical protein